MKILLLNYKLPVQKKDGGEYAQFTFAEGLSNTNNSEIHLLALNTNIPKVKSIQLPKELHKIQEFDFVNHVVSPTILGAISHIFKKNSYFCSRFYSTEFADKISSRIQKEKYDIIHLEHVYLGKYIPIIRKFYHGKIILRAQNIEYELWSSVIRFTKNPFKKWYLKIQNEKLKKYETTVFKQVDGVITYTEKDMESVSKYISPEKIMIIPPGLKTHSNPDIFFSDKIKFYFIGSFDWTPNYHGINWFLKNILPEAIIRFPKAEFHFAGKKMPEKRKNEQFPNCFFHGEVENAEEFIYDKQVLIAPLFIGGGIKFKVMEALIFQKAVICTNHAAIGFEPFHSLLQIADTKDEFLHAIEKLMTEHKTHSANLCKEIQTCFDPQLNSIKTIRFYQKIQNHP